MDWSRIVVSENGKVRQSRELGAEYQMELRELAATVGGKEAIKQRLKDEDDMLLKLTGLPGISQACLKLQGLFEYYKPIETLTFGQASTLFPLLKSAENGASYSARIPEMTERLKECCQKFRPFKEDGSGIDLTRAAKPKDMAEFVKSLLPKSNAVVKTASEKLFDAIRTMPGGVKALPEMADKYDAVVWNNLAEATIARILRTATAEQLGELHAKIEERIVAMTAPANTEAAPTVAE